MTSQSQTQIETHQYYSVIRIDPVKHNIRTQSLTYNHSLNRPNVHDEVAGRQECDQHDGDPCDDDDNDDNNDDDNKRTT